ncbi:hypothetical protein ACJJTC_016363 [Scirpophaga incertulas]
MEHARPPPELCLEGNSISRADAWKRWKTQFNLFVKASGAHKESGDVQASLLINLLGSEGFDIYETLIFEDEKQREDVTIVIQKFDKYFDSAIKVCQVDEVSSASHRLLESGCSTIRSTKGSTIVDAVAVAGSNRGNSSRGVHRGGRWRCTGVARPQQAYDCIRWRWRSRVGTHLTIVTDVVDSVRN